jgi:DNA-binding response OmpR family regulator
LTMPGLEVRAIRQALAPAAPAVFLLHRGQSRPHGLNSPPAARRWLTRPFSPRTLVVAVAELLHPMPGQRRPAGSGGADRGRHEMVVNGRDVSLTRTEFALVTALAGHPGRVLSRQRLLAALESERGKRPSPRAVDVYIAQLDPHRARRGLRAGPGRRSNVKVWLLHCGGKLQGCGPDHVRPGASIGGATFPI